jgi:PAS domain-containing protein
MSNVYSESAPAGSEQPLDEFFAMLGRDGIDELQAATRLLQGVPLLQDLIDAVPLPIWLLSENGQVVLANHVAGQMIDDGGDCAMGKRPGELLGCVHAKEGVDGCGTSRHCERCGAMVSVLTSQRSDEQVTREYRLTRESRQGIESVRLAATSTPIQVGEQRFAVYVVRNA